MPGTIGAITWLATHESKVKNIKHGLVLSLLGDAGRFTYKKSRQGSTEIDKAAEHVLKTRNPSNNVIDFVPYGYDERQYCSPGFDLAVGCLSRTPYGQFPQYHTSADDLSFIRPEHLGESVATALEIVNLLEANRKFINLSPKCEPQLGKRGLYSRGDDNNSKEFQLALLWTLNLSDGKHSVLDIAERSKIPFKHIQEAADRLLECNLLEEAQ